MELLTFVTVGALLPAVSLLLSWRVRTGVGDLGVEADVLRLDGCEVLGLSVLGVLPAVCGGWRRGPVLYTDTHHSCVGVVVTDGHLLLRLDGDQGSRGRCDGTRVTAGVT